MMGENNTDREQLASWRFRQSSSRAEPSEYKRLLPTTDAGPFFNANRLGLGLTRWPMAVQRV